MKRDYWYLIVIALLIAGLFYYKNQAAKNNTIPENSSTKTTNVERQITPKTNSENADIEQLTQEKIVVDYLKANKKLPNYYITKSEARKQGWIASQGNLCDAIPNKAIGGDYFSNRQKILPDAPGRKYFEADINYNCGRRNADRIVFSNDGLIFVTLDHYKTFQQK